MEYNPRPHQETDLEKGKRALRWSIIALILMLAAFVSQIATLVMIFMELAANFTLHLPFFPTGLLATGCFVVGNEARKKSAEVAPDSWNEPPDFY